MDRNKRQSRSRKTSHLLAGIIGVVIGVLFTLLQIQQSLAQGQLSLPITYDDCIYFSDALRRLFHFYNQGLSGLITNWFSTPPHSPTSAFTPLLGFSIFGRHDWAPAAANGIYLIGLLWLVAYLTSALPWFHRITIVVVLLTCPIVGHLIIESRPDILWGIAIACASFVLLKETAFEATQKTRILAGLLAGLSFLAKPSVSPITALILLTTLVIAIAMSLLQSYHQTDSKFKDWKFYKQILLILRQYIPFFVVTFLLILPHYLVAFKQITDYIYITVFGENKGIWEIRVPLAEHLLYYISGPGGKMMFGSSPFSWGGIALYIGLFSVVLTVLVNGWRSLLKILPYLMVIGVTYLLVSIPKVKSPFLGMSFGGMILLATLVSLINTLQTFRKWSGRTYRVLGNAACVAIIMASLWSFQWPVYNKIGRALPFPNSFQASYERALLAGILQRIEPGLKQATATQCTPQFVVVPDANHLNSGTLEYELLKLGTDNFVIIPNVLHSSYLGDFQQQALQADYVIALSADNPTSVDLFVTNKIHTKVLEQLNANQKLALIETFERPQSFGGGKVFLYQKKILCNH